MLTKFSSVVAQEIIKSTAFGATNDETFAKWYFIFNVMWSQVHRCSITANIMGESLIHIYLCP